MTKLCFFKTGDVAETVSGRDTTPFPKVDVSIFGE